MRAALPALLPLAVLASASLAQITHVANYPFSGNSAGDNLGLAVSGAGDVNNDGVADIIVGAYQDDDNGLSSGTARVISGATGLTLYSYAGEDIGYRLGQSVSGAGDVNNDGFDDFVIGVPGDDANGNNAGSARVYSGADGSLLYAFDGDGISTGFGLAVSGAGDVNNDGFDDVIAGSRDAYPNGFGSGIARVYSGANGSVLYTFEGTAATQYLGVALAGAGDVNNDGFDDVIVGSANDFDDDGTGIGSATVYSGANGSVLHTFVADSAGDAFGESVAGAGDVNNDGFDDVIVGARFDDNNGNNSGSARVFSGANGAILYTFNGATQFLLGVSVDGAGDINNDGWADLIVGATGDGAAGPNAGSVRVYSGQDGSVLHTSFGDAELDGYGRSVSGVGDLNNDGIDDFLVGAPGADNNGPSSGVVKAFLSVTVEPTPCYGDVNNDGIVNFVDLNGVLGSFGNPCPE